MINWKDNDVKQQSPRTHATAQVWFSI